jgi:hypothetical protein
LLEFDSDGARFLFDLASAAGAQRADRTVAGQGPIGPASRDDEADRLKHHAQTRNISKEHHQQAAIL